ncbi:MAG TPA: cysteine--tRNA ligase [Candidatus Lumbricidophila sp.]|nr:cysteine--tRNA ligase [Candidatus Lumbricidophila sp.]
MTIRLYDSKAQSLRDFVPRVEGQVGIYVCGPTVQSSPHIGHLRSALAYDVMRRWFTYRGYQVTVIRNVTDIDDKVLQLAGDEEWWARAYRIELEFTAGYQTLDIAPPTYEPRATASVMQMQELIASLIERGHAYPALDGSGDVYFDTASWPTYGELTRQSRANMEPATDADPRGKRDPRDFALWKGRKSDEPASASWASPWGAGRPGWHIECSAMAHRYLGEAFDIHGGGLDLRFPHHENELAQSTAAGHAFATYWVHNGLVQVNGQKMSKSLGNSVFAADLFASATPLAVRYLLTQAHYRTNFDLTDTSLAEAQAAVDRIATVLARAEREGVAAAAAEVPSRFAAAMDDDLGVPSALAVLHETVRAANLALDAGDASAAATAVAELAAMLNVLGINPADAHWSVGDAGPAHQALDVLITGLLEARSRAREQRDWARADEIRDSLAAAGVQIEDGAAGSHWSLA